MKRKLKQLKTDIKSVTHSNCLNMGDFSEVEILIKENVFDTDDIYIGTYVDDPETLKEFRELNGLTKLELLEWLKENYK